MFPVTITIHNSNQLNAVMAAMGGDIPQPAAQAIHVAPKAEKAETPKAQKAKTDPKPDAAPSSEPAQTASDNSENSSTEAGDSGAEQPTYQEVAALITKVSRSAGRDAAIGLLASFDAKRGPDLKPEQYADVIAACEKVLA